MLFISIFHGTHVFIYGNYSLILPYSTLYGSMIHWVRSLLLQSEPKHSSYSMLQNMLLVACCFSEWYALNRKTNIDRCMCHHYHYNAVLSKQNRESSNFVEISIMPYKVKEKVDIALTEYTFSSYQLKVHSKLHGLYGSINI